MVTGDLARFDESQFFKVHSDSPNFLIQQGNVNLVKGDYDFKLQGTEAVFKFEEILETLKEKYPERFI